MHYAYLKFRGYGKMNFEYCSNAIFPQRSKLTLKAAITKEEEYVTSVDAAIGHPAGGGCP